MSFTEPQLLPLIQDRLAPWLTAQADPYGDHGKFLQAVAAMGQPLYGLSADSGDDPDDPSWVPGWGLLFDPDDCPTAYLPFLAQLVGVPASALAGASDATARQIIRAEQGQQRGTVTAITSAAKRFLTGTQTLTMFERTASNGSTPDGYHFVIVVQTSQVTSASGLQAAVDAVRPAGVLWTLIQTSSWLISQLETAGYASLTAMEAAFPSISNLETDVT